MKKSCQLFTILLLSVVSLLNANLLDFYKKGTIKIEPDPEFGKDVQWDSIFFHERKEVAIAPDGSIFVSNPAGHNFFKFSSEGKLLGKYGRLGSGPGDLYYPLNLSTLGSKYLVIGEHAERRRISLFDFSGKCEKVLKTKHMCVRTVALKNNHIAYLSRQCTTGKNKSESICKVTPIIKNIVTGDELPVDSSEYISRSIVLKIGMHISIGNFKGEPFMERTKEGNLLVGMSNSQIVKIYSPQGEILNTFSLNIPSIPVTDGYIKDFKKQVINDMKNSTIKNNALYKIIKKAVEKTSFNDFFEEHLPYYRQVLVDSEGNILVFKWPECVGKHMEVFRVYTPDGKFVCETTIDDGIFDFQVDSVIKNIQFTGKGIFGIFKLENADDTYVRLVKVNLK